MFLKSTIRMHFNPSANILREHSVPFEYMVTRNTALVAEQLLADFNKGVHAFTLIGSYGTGKSSFLSAFEFSLRGEERFFDVEVTESIKIIKLIGEFDSLIKSFGNTLGLPKNKCNSENILDSLHQVQNEVDLTVIMIDEFGKFLEYAAKNNAAKQLYFVQQLAEFVNDPSRNILLITTLHQSFDAYSFELKQAQRNEWTKVKGRLKEITFNEPVEHLLLLAATRLDGSKRTVEHPEELVQVLKEKQLLNLSEKTVSEVSTQLQPLDLFSAYVLTLALQRYGQNERSLFTFLAGEESIGINRFKGNWYHLGNVYDYLNYHFHFFLSTQHNPDYIFWRTIQDALGRAEILPQKEAIPATLLIKSIGLLGLFGARQGKIDLEFLEFYGKNYLGIDSTQELIDKLSKKKIIRFFRYDQRYKLFDGTDLDIEYALINAAGKVNRIEVVVDALKYQFDWAPICAKEATYRTGTPRFFEFRFSEKPLIDEVPNGEVDGFINLVFNQDLSLEELLELSQGCEEAVIFAYYANVGDIRDQLFEIEKTKKVIEENREDLVAVRELNEILGHNKRLLQRFVVDGLYSESVIWVKRGEIKSIANSRQLNRELSDLCSEVYPHSPEYKNELVNRHKIPGVIHTARKNYYRALAIAWSQADLGFPEEKFPAEKTIYATFLKENSIHKKSSENVYGLGDPRSGSSFTQVWEACQQFLNDSASGRKKLSDLVGLLRKRPFKLKQGLIDLLVPTFLFVKRESFALYGKNGYIPAFNPELFDLLVRNTDEYQIKAFDVADIRLEVFNKYRELLNQRAAKRPTSDSFIETISPFLVFYRDLDEYARNTKRISKEALSLRFAIKKAEDPEKAFFEDFPRALGTDLNQLNQSGEALEAYIKLLRQCIEEIHTSFAKLLDRMEEYLLERVLGIEADFENYKVKLQQRFASLEEYMLLQHQKTFMKRLNSPIEDRDAWLASIGQAVLGKRLIQIKDDEEIKLYKELEQIIQELDNLIVLAEVDADLTQEKVMKVDITSIGEQKTSKTVRLNKKQLEVLEQQARKIKGELSDDNSLNVAILTRLLEEAIRNAES